jgi:hypothetical protein
MEPNKTSKGVPSPIWIDLLYLAVTAFVGAAIIGSRITAPRDNEGTPGAIGLLVPVILFLGQAVAAVLYPYIAMRRRRTPEIGSPPGAGLLAVVDFLFSPRTVEETFKPLIADWRFEYFEALKQSRVLKARWISVRYVYAFITVMSLSRLLSFLNQLKSVTK